MASLLKPSVCGACGGSEFKHVFKPERWACNGCGSVEAERPMRDSTKCRECGVSRDDKEFKQGKNLCLDCFNNYMRTWRNENQEQWHEYRNKPEVKKARKAAVRKAVQRSPESFVRYLMHHLTKQSNYNKRHDGWKKRLPRQHSLSFPVQIDFDYLWALYGQQDGFCALSLLPMTYQFNDLCSISVDRIDSGLGYVPGNIQLVCKWVNLAKGRHSNEEFLGLLDKYYTERLRRRQHFATGVDAGVND